MRIGSSVGWVLRSLLRSPRVRFATSVGLVMHLLSIVLLAKLHRTPDIPEFVHLLGFIPIAVLATVTGGNLFGVDRGSTLTALTAPVGATAYGRVRLVASLGWMLVVLAVGWVVGAVLIGGFFVPVFLLQLAFTFLLCAVAGTLSVVAPSSRAYARMAGQTMSLPALIALNVISLLTIAGAIKLLSGVTGLGWRATLAAGCAVAALIVAIAGIEVTGRVFRARREIVLNAIRENP